VRVESLERSASGRIQAAIEAALAPYRADLGDDPNLRVIRVEVRLRPGGSVRRVVVSRDSEFEDHVQR